MVKKPLASLRASLLSLFRYSENTGIKATVREPSPKSLLKRLGILNATKNASVMMPEPNIRAITMSLISPKIRLRNVKAPTIPAALSILSSEEANAFFF